MIGVVGVSPELVKILVNADPGLLAECLCQFVSARGVFRKIRLACCSQTFTPPKNTVPIAAPGVSVFTGVYSGIITQSWPMRFNAIASALSRMHDPQYIPAAPAASTAMRKRSVVGTGGELISLV